MRPPLTVFLCCQPLFQVTLTKRDLFGGKGFFLNELILLLVKRLKLMNITNDLAAEVLHASGQKLSPVHLVHIVNHWLGRHNYALES